MARTRLRPVPAGLVAANDALAFGLTLSLLSVLTLAAAANLLAAGLLAFTIFYYVVIYSMWLKRTTPMNIVIGGAAGALPPVVGYAAAGGGVTLDSLLLFAIIFMWTPPHFWALSLYRADDYAKAGIPMLPVVAGDRATRIQILIYTLLLWPVSLAPTLLGFSGWIYGGAAIALNLGFTALGARLLVDRRDAAARAMFLASLLYLFLLFACLIVDRIAA
jgi:protoheme IX farnesyltransferase